MDKNKSSLGVSKYEGRSLEVRAKAHCEVSREIKPKRAPRCGPSRSRYVGPTRSHAREASVPLTTDRKVMRLQDYIKYLLCFCVAAQTFVVNCDRSPIPSPIDSLINERQARGILDLLFGRFRTCGGCLCGRANRGGARLLGGEYTQSHEFPWLANIHVKSQLLVSGVLINDRYVLTAASQLIGATAPEIKVSLGEYDRCTLDVSSLNVSVESVFPYPEYNPETQAHDLALMRLSRPISFEKRISPVCLPNPGASYLGQVGTVVGWIVSRSIDSGDSRTCRPRKLGLPILGRSECIKSGIDAMNFQDDSGCAGVIGGTSMVCENDVGASVQYRSYSGIYDLVGILSGANKCDNTNQTAQFTRVGQHLDWILQHTKDACYCTK